MIGTIPERWRLTRVSLRHVKPANFIIFDRRKCYPPTLAYVRSQTHMIGYAVIDRWLACHGSNSESTKFAPLLTGKRFPVAPLGSLFMCDILIACEVNRVSYLVMKCIVAQIAWCDETNARSTLLTCLVGIQGLGQKALMVWQILQSQNQPSWTSSSLKLQS